MAAAWKELDEKSKAPYEACAALDRVRKEVDGFKGSSARSASVDSLGPLIRSTLNVLAKAPPTSLSCSETAAKGLVEALERLDSRLQSSAGRAAAAASIRSIAAGSGGNIMSSPKISSAAAAVGARLGGRLVQVLKRWATSTPSRPSTPASSVVERKPKSSKTSAKMAAVGAALGGTKRPASAASGDKLSDETRSRVVGMLMRVAARGAGKASFARCQAVERALFDRYGSDMKEYRSRARSLSFNLGSSDGALLQRVLDGDLEAAQLVRLEAEDLASDALKAERQAERDRYFRSELLLTEKPKRRRGLRGGRKGERDEIEEDPPDTQPASQGDQADSQTALLPEAESTSAVAVADNAAASEDGSSDSDSSSSSEDDDEGSASESDGDSLFGDASTAIVAADGPSAADAETEATEGDAELARYLQMASPTSPSSSSSSSRSQSPEPIPAAARGSSSSSSSSSSSTLMARTATTPPPTATAPPAVTPPAVTPPAPAPAPPVLSAAAVGSLQAMGFESGEVSTALMRTKGDVQKAVAILLAGKA
eukprot:TRINITY_DN20142_c0_g3_i2.p1 TRINITY_DN20142_c0_g3~~TRINITY_DN20142_c0_g3_i2.p1  ORF type:complete len:634 (+),score=168.03 TRINITY_DN20142_c0_g3_i2:282-1904(+)